MHACAGQRPRMGLCPIERQAEPQLPWNVAAPTPRRRVRGVASLPSTHKTHTRTHALEFAPDREEAARDPGVADKWARVVSRSGERRKKEKEEEEKRARTGPTSPRMRRAQEEIRPDDALPFFFFFYTALTRESHLSVRPAD